jgi:hypothetical protein
MPVERSAPSSAGPPSVRVVGESVCLIASLLSAKVDRRVLRVVIVAWMSRTLLGLEALVGRPGLDQRPIHSEVLRGQQVFVATLS